MSPRYLWRGTLLLLLVLNVCTSAWLIGYERPAVIVSAWRAWCWVLSDGILAYIAFKAGAEHFRDQP